MTADSQFIGFRASVTKPTQSRPCHQLFLLSLEVVFEEEEEEEMAQNEAEQIYGRILGQNSCRILSWNGLRLELKAHC